MKKQIRTNRQYNRILVSVLIALMGLGIGISCSKDTGVSSRRLVGTKPAVGGSNYADFHPQTGVNYDPFDGMGLRARQQAIGGPEAAEKFLKLVVAQVASAMNDERARSVLYDHVPQLDQGEVHLTELATKNPDLLRGLSGGFKNALNNKSMGGQLHRKAKEASTDSEAILKVVKGLFDMSLTLVTPPGMGWNSASDKIPVFYMPMDDETGLDPFWWVPFKRYTMSPNLFKIVLCDLLKKSQK